MNAAHLHLLITHIPMLGPMFGLWLLLVALWRRSQELQRTSLWVFVLAGLSAIPTYLSGRPASSLLMRLMPGMPTDAGDQHAEIAVIALVAALVLGAISLLGLLMPRKTKTVSGWLVGSVFLLALGTATLMIWTANLGGKIRHPEIENSSPATSAIH